MNTADTAQQEIINALSPHLHARHIQATDYGGITWVQVGHKWARIEPLSPTPGQPSSARSYRITTGLEAGADLTGGEVPEPQIGYVGGIRFGMVPHVLRWVDYHGHARP